MTWRAGPSPERAAKRVPGEPIMASKQANRLLRKLLEDEQDGLPFDEVTLRVMDRCGVQENTAETYVRRSDHTHVEHDMDGNKVVVSPEHASETMVHGDEVIEKEVGSPTGDKFGELDILEDVSHPLVEEIKQHETGYIRRRMGDKDMELNKKTDVQVFTSIMQDPDYSVQIIGKHGVGKDKLALHTCANTNRPVLRLVANDDPDFVDLIVGTYAPDGNGDFVHKKGLLTIAIQNGYTFILDEFNLLSGKVQSMLNMILESADQNRLVIPETNEVINPHPQFKFVATQNPDEVGYSGRESVDQATGSRFIPMTLPPLDGESERMVVAQETHWDKDSYDLRQLLREDGGVITGARTLHDMGKVSTWVSTRDVIQVGRMTEKLGSVRAAAELVLLGRADPEDKDPIGDCISDHRW